MRRPSSTFRQALKAYQKALGPPGDHWKGRLAHEIIARWLDHPECESIWSTLQPFLLVPPGVLIGGVILTRFDAENFKGIASKLPDYEAKMPARTKRHLRTKKYRESAREIELMGETIELRDRLLGREKTGPRLNFMRRWSARFELWCGQPLDYEVSLLTAIAFDDDKITAEAVRAARRGDRSTRTPK
jgi:hypothetical protein